MKIAHFILLISLPALLGLAGNKSIVTQFSELGIEIDQQLVLQSPLHGELGSFWQDLQTAEYRMIGMDSQSVETHVNIEQISSQDFRQDSTKNVILRWLADLAPEIKKVDEIFSKVNPPQDCIPPQYPANLYLVPQKALNLFLVDKLWQLESPKLKERQLALKKMNHFASTLLMCSHSFIEKSIALSFVKRVLNSQTELVQEMALRHEIRQAAKTSEISRSDFISQTIRFEFTNTLWTTAPGIKQLQRIGDSIRNHDLSFILPPMEEFLQPELAFFEIQELHRLSLKDSHEGQWEKSLKYFETLADKSVKPPELNSFVGAYLEKGVVNHLKFLKLSWDMEASGTWNNFLGRTLLTIGTRLSPARLQHLANQWDEVEAFRQRLAVSLGDEVEAQQTPSL